MSLISEFARVAQDRLEQIAVITESSQMSYSDILATVDVLDHELAARGVKPGQTLVMTVQRAEFTIAFTLLMSLRGLTVIFAPAAEVMAADIPFDRVVGTDPADFLPPDRQLILEGHWFDGLRDRPLPDYTDAGTGGTFVARTSGSTGSAKFVISSEAERMAAMRSGFGFVRLDLAGRRFATTLSPAASWSLSAGMGMLLAGGSVLMLTDGQDKILSYIDLYRVDTLITTPVVMTQLLDLPRARQYLGSLRDIRIGGAMVAKPILDRVAAITGARIHVGYGAAEIGTLLGHVHEAGNPAPSGFLGNPVRDEIEVGLYSDTLEPLPPEATEGIVGFKVTDSGLTRRYVNGSGLTDGAGLAEDVFFPGDILRRDEMGYHFVGRTKNILNFSGNKISLDVVSTHLSLAFPEQRIVPLVETGEDGLERLLLVHAGPEPLDPDKVEAALLARFDFAPVSRIERVEHLPLTETGKVDTEALRMRFKPRD